MDDDSNLPAPASSSEGESDKFMDAEEPLPDPPTNDYYDDEEENGDSVNGQGRRAPYLPPPFLGQGLGKNQNERHGYADDPYEDEEQPEDEFWQDKDQTNHLTRGQALGKNPPGRQGYENDDRYEEEEPEDEFWQDKDEQNNLAKAGPPLAELGKTQPSANIVRPIPKKRSSKEAYNGSVKDRGISPVPQPRGNQTRELDPSVSAELAALRRSLKLTKPEKSIQIIDDDEDSEEWDESPNPSPQYRSFKEKVEWAEKIALHSKTTEKHSTTTHTYSVKSGSTSSEDKWGNSKPSSSGQAGSKFTFVPGEADVQEPPAEVFQPIKR